MRNRNDGFTLFFVIIFLTLVGLAMALLGNMSRNFAGKAIKNELRLHISQLLYSGRAWANVNAERLAGMEKGESVELDVKEFSARQAKCFVKVIQIDKDRIVAKILASCSKGRIDVSRAIETTIIITY